jgi:hypothetical protein
MRFRSYYSHAVKIRLGSAGEVEVNDDIHGLDIDTTSKEICQSQQVEWAKSHSQLTGTNKVTGHALAEVVEDTVTMRLEHLGV